MTHVPDQNRTVTITFNNGDSRTFSYSSLNIDVSNFSASMESILESTSLVLEFDDALMIIPTTSIQSYLISPKPAQKFSGAIRVIKELD